MKTNTQFKNDALAALKGNWGKAVLATLVYFIIAAFVAGPSTWTSIQMQDYMKENVGSYASIRTAQAMLADPAYQTLQSRMSGTSAFLTLLEILVLIPLTVGYANALRRLLVSGDNDILKNSFKIALDGYWHKVWTMLVVFIFTTLWSFLLIIPGIIKALSYAMTKYIIQDNPELTASESIHRSRMMMRGHKFDLFWLYLSFLGWFILGLFTFGIGYFWLVPYMETAEASFYEEVKADYALNGGLD